jgi:hypothetical protein
MSHSRWRVLCRDRLLSLSRRHLMRRLDLYQVAKASKRQSRRNDVASEVNLLAVRRWLWGDPEPRMCERLFGGVPGFRVKGEELHHQIGPRAVHPTRCQLDTSIKAERGVGRNSREPRFAARAREHSLPLVCHIAHRGVHGGQIPRMSLCVRKSRQGAPFGKSLSVERTASREDLKKLIPIAFARKDGLAVVHFSKYASGLTRQPDSTREK